VDWGTRRKPLGAIIAWGSLAVFAVLTILGIAGLVLGLQPQPVATAQIEVAAAEPVPAPTVEERLPAEISFADAKAAEAVAVAPAPGVAPDVRDAGKADALIASTFEQLVKPVVVPENEVPAGAVATVKAAASAATPAETTVASARVDLPMGKNEAAAIASRSRTVSRNAAAWAIESEVPDEDSAKGSALGYAAQPADDGVRVGDSSINVRSGPSPDNKRLFALAAGADVEVAGKADGWVSIKDDKGREGWVDATLLENLDLEAIAEVKAPAAVEPEKPTNVKRVAGAGVTVRAGPGKSNKQLFNLAGGSEVTVSDNSKGWLKITDAKGRTGWAYKDFVR
jgi:SH3-like domain-containing protein